MAYITWFAVTFIYFMQPSTDNADNLQKAHARPAHLAHSATRQLATSLDAIKILDDVLMHAGNALDVMHCVLPGFMLTLDALL